jgi:hypothetical protein
MNHTRGFHRFAWLAILPLAQTELRSHYRIVTVTRIWLLLCPWLSIPAKS